MRSVIRSDGVSGLLARGLSTRIVANGLSGMVFSVRPGGSEDFLAPCGHIQALSPLRRALETLKRSLSEASARARARVKSDPKR